MSDRLEELKKNAYAKQAREHKTKAMDLELKYSALEAEHKALKMEHSAATRTLSVFEKREKKRLDGAKKAREAKAKKKPSK